MRKSKIDTYSIQQLQHILDTSTSSVDVLKTIGLSGSCGNRQTLKNRIVLYDLSTLKLDENRKIHLKKHGEQLRKQCRLDDDSVFIENSTYCRGRIKKRIIDGDMLPYICDSCGQLPFWNDDVLVLQLDHKNGINNDNRMCNLRFICPNCHTQTSTFSGKHKRKINKCIDCNTTIHRKSTRCVSCAQIVSNSNISKRPDVNILIDDIISTNIEQAGIKYGVSGNSIRKWCRFYDIPTRRVELLKMRE
jgi:hypothetical protein